MSEPREISHGLPAFAASQLGSGATVPQPLATDERAAAVRAARNNLCVGIDRSSRGWYALALRYEATVSELESALASARQDTERLNNFATAVQTYLASRGFVWDQALVAELDDGDALTFMTQGSVQPLPLREAMDAMIAKYPARPYSAKAQFMRQSLAALSSPGAEPAPSDTRLSLTCDHCGARSGPSFDVSLGQECGVCRRGFMRLNTSLIRASAPSLTTAPTEPK